MSGDYTYRDNISVRLVAKTNEAKDGKNSPLTRSLLQFGAQRQKHKQLYSRKMVTVMPKDI